MLILNFFIPFMSLIFGAILLIGDKFNKKFFISYKSFIVNLDTKNILPVCPILFTVTIIARSYCLHLTNNTSVFNITLILIQLMISFHFAIIANLTADSDINDEGNLLNF